MKRNETLTSQPYDLPMAFRPRSIRVRSGFTLIEISIVLVIIGLIVGGVLVGQDLIHTAMIRAQVSQIEKYNSAVNTFRVKYNALPGDILGSQANQLGLGNRSTAVGRGDGNGLLEGGAAGSSNVCGENYFFWLDLYNTGLIADQIMADQWNFPSVSGDTSHCPGNVLPNYTANNVLPPARLRTGDFITVYSDRMYNYYQILGYTCIAPQHGGMCYLPGATSANQPGITPLEAMAIDNKIDDGFPTTGTVQTRDITTFSNSAPPSPGLAGTATAGYCGNTDTSPTTYNTGTSFANTLLCSISIRFQ